MARMSFPIDSASLPPELQLAKFDPDATGELADVYSRAPAVASGFARCSIAQHYRLVHWRDGPREINYRRFFDVNDLVSRARRGPGVFRADPRVHARASFATA